MMSVPGTSAPSAGRKGLTPATGCILSLLIGGAGLVILIAAMTLALREELTFGRGTPQEVRLWLITEPGNQGLGFSMAHRISRSEDGTRECDVRQVRFLLWRSEGPASSASYCECYVRGPEGWDSLGACPSG